MARKFDAGGQANALAHGREGEAVFAINNGVIELNIRIRRIMQMVATLGLQRKAIAQHSAELA